MVAGGAARFPLGGMVVLDCAVKPQTRGDDEVEEKKPAGKKKNARARMLEELKAELETEKQAKETKGAKAGKKEKKEKKAKAKK